MSPIQVSDRLKILGDLRRGAIATSLPVTHLCKPTIQENFFIGLAQTDGELIFSIVLLEINGRTAPKPCIQ